MPDPAFFTDIRAAKSSWRGIAEASLAGASWGLGKHGSCRGLILYAGGPKKTSALFDPAWIDQARTSRVLRSSHANGSRGH